jgi:hypothetical protein
MGLTVNERGVVVATHRYILVKLMETLARWVPTTPEMEVKLLFGSHIWDVAQHADALGKRAHELRLPLQHSVAPVDGYLRVLGDVEAVTDTKQRITAFYDVILPGLASRYRRYLDETDHLMDAPTVRILERILQDHERMIRESRQLREETPNLGDMQPDWSRQLADAEAAQHQIFAASRRAASAEA